MSTEENTARRAWAAEIRAGCLAQGTSHLDRHRGASRASWEILVDFAAFPSWNPFIVQAKGRAESAGD